MMCSSYSGGLLCFYWFQVSLYVIGYWPSILSHKKNLNHKPIITCVIFNMCCWIVCQFVFLFLKRVFWFISQAGDWYVSVLCVCMWFARWQTDKLDENVNVSGVLWVDEIVLYMKYGRNHFYDRHSSGIFCLLKHLDFVFVLRLKYVML
jgi:hypothetical protein